MLKRVNRWPCDSAIIEQPVLIFREAKVRDDRFNIRTVLMVMVCLLVTVTSILAQSDTSSMSGTVTDVSGALVPGAQITIHNNATLADRTIASNENGAFTLTNLPPGDYSIRAT